MNVRSLIIVLALLFVAGAVYANGATGAQPQVTTPAGAGTGTTEPAEAEMTTPTPAGAGMGTGDTTCVPVPGTAGAGPAVGTTTTMVISPEAEIYNRNFVSQHFGISQSTIADLRTRHDWGTIYFMANLAQRTGRPVTEIASLAEQGMTWNQIAMRYNVAMSDLTVPVATARVAGFVAEFPVTTVQRTWISDRYGNVVLTDREARRLNKMGYSWEDIAVAVNVSIETGVPVYQVLQWTDRGLTWNEIALEYGLNADDIVNPATFQIDSSGNIVTPMTVQRETVIITPAPPAPQTMPGAPPPPTTPGY